MLRTFIIRWLFLFILIVFNLFIGLKTSIGFFHFFFWFMVVISLLSLTCVLTEYFLAKINIKRNTVSKIELEDNLEVEVVVRNIGLLPIINIVIEDCVSFTGLGDKEKRVALEYLAANSSRVLKYQCLCLQRGKHVLGPLKVYFFDPFGIFFFSKTYRIYSELYVYPKTFNIKKFPPLTNGIAPWFGIESGRISGDDDEFYGLREYKEGDPIKKIHWASTARQNKLIVKQFQRQSFFRATLIFNLEKEKNFGEGEERISEYIIKIAASISKYLLERDVSLEIIANAQEIVHIPSNKGPEHLENIFRFLSVARAESKSSLNEIFEDFSHRIPNDSTLIVIMLDKDWEGVSSILPLEKRNISLIPLILISSTFLSSFDTKEMVKDIKIKLSRVFHVNPLLILRQDNLEEVFLRY